VPSLAECQRNFARALLDPCLPPPGGIRVPADAVLEERFAVYRNNVAVGLIEALRASFPVVERLVGADFFTAMARAHALQSPPSSPVLLEYGGQFPDFIERFEPAAPVPYLAEVARLEWLCQESYHAVDAAALALSALEAVPVDHLPELKLRLHPSARIGSFSHPALSIWRLHGRGADFTAADIPARGEAVLIVRPQMAVEIHELSPGALAFLRSLQANRSIESAVTAALGSEPGIGLARLLRALFTAGAFAGFLGPRKAQR